MPPFGCGGKRGLICASRRQAVNRRSDHVIETSAGTSS
jgi:hypothetical protein